MKYKVHSIDVSEYVLSMDALGTKCTYTWRELNRCIIEEAIFQNTLAMCIYWDKLSKINNTLMQETVRGFRTYIYGDVYGEVEEFHFSGAFTVTLKERIL